MGREGMKAGRKSWPAALFFLAGTVVCTWPMAPRFADGLADLWDAKLNAWILHWDFHQLFRDPLHLYDANIFFPARYALAFSENLLGAAVFAFPLFAAGLSTLAVYNLVFLLGMFLSGLAAWTLARYVTGDAWAASLAGVVYAFCPWRIAQIPHVQFQWGAFLALSLLFLLRYLREGGRRDAVLFAVCFAWNALCNVHYAFFSAFLVAVALFVEGSIAGWPAIRGRVRGSLVALAAASLFVAPFLVPYALASKLYGMERGYSEMDVFSGVWTDFLTAGGQNKLYAPLTRKWAKAEGELFPGLTPIALAVVALAWRRREERRPALRQAPPGKRRVAAILDVFVLAAAAVWIAALAGRRSIGPLMIREPSRIAVILTLLVLVRLAWAFPRRSRFADAGDLFRRVRFGPDASLFLAIAVVGVVVSLGTHTPYYRFLVESFGPVFHAIRAPSRGVVLFDIGVGVLAALGLSALTRGRRPAVRLAIVTLAVLATGFEYRAFPLEVARVDPEPPPVDRWLATVPMSGAVMEWPFATEREVDYEFRSTAHWKPLNNGASGFAPPRYVAFASLFTRSPIPEEVWGRMSELGTGLVILHADALVGNARVAYARFAANGVAAGKLEPVRLFPHGADEDAVFRVRGERPGSATAPGERSAASTAVTKYLTDLIEQGSPPFGVIDSPTEEATARAGEWGFGWALDDSGIAQVLVSADGSAASPAMIGLVHPGIAEAYPNYPDTASAGFGFSVPRLPPGEHVLTVTLVAKDGGRTELARRIRIR